MSKKKGKCFIIRNEIYPFDVMVSIDETDDKLLNRLLGYGNTKEECEPLLGLAPTVGARCVMLPSNQTVIRLKIIPDKYQLMGNVTHEVFHAATFLMDRIGVKFEVLGSDEAYAYFICFLSKEIFKILKL